LIATLTFTEFVQQVINGLSLGGTYALIALGLALLYSIMGLINFAYGELLTIGGYIMWTLFAHGLSWPLVAGVTVIGTALASMAMERIAFRPFRGADLVTLLLTSFALSLLLQTIFTIWISPQAEGIALPAWVSKVVTIGPFLLPRLQIITLGTVLVAVLALQVFLRRTLLGTAIRAAAEDFAVVRLMGINANRVVISAFGISGLLAGIAALLYIGNAGAVGPTTGVEPTIKAFIAVIIGGLGSLNGAVAGGILLGLAEVLFTATLPSSLTPFVDAFSLGLVICILFIRREGLLGRQRHANV
jgi:branched-chain amino acid transport system permease protein